MGETAYYLNREELWQLTRTWASWANSVVSPGRMLARARLHLFFLLTRFGGMRSNEISTFTTHASLDRQTGLLQLKDRRIFLPPVAMRPIRQILAFKESEANDFLRIDPGFLRKTFYNLGKLANLPPQSCAARALRYARGLEMLELHISPQVVAESLGLSSPVPLLRILGQRGKFPATPNHFPAIITDVETDFHAARLFFKVAFGFALTGIYPLQEIAAFEPREGKAVNLSIPPGLIFPSAIKLPMANHLRGHLTSLKRDAVEIHILFKLNNFKLLISQDNLDFNANQFDTGECIDIYIPSHAIKLSIP